MRSACAGLLLFVLMLACIQLAGADTATRYVLWTKRTSASPPTTVTVLPGDLPFEPSEQSAGLLDRSAEGFVAVATAGSVVIERSDGSERAVVPLPGVYDGSFSGDGSRLALAALDCGTDAFLCQSLYVVGSDGTNLRLVSARSGDARWTRDGRLAYVARVDANGIGVLTIDGPAGGKPQTLGRAFAYQHVAPAPSPNGTLIAYQCRLQSICISTTKPPRRAVTRFRGNVTATPLWSPGGARIALTLAGNYTSTTAVGTIRTGALEPTSSPPSIATDDTVLAWSPNGATILIQRRCDGAVSCRDQVFSQAVATSARHRLTNDHLPWETVQWTRTGITYVTPPGP